MKLLEKYNEQRLYLTELEIKLGLSSENIRLKHGESQTS